MHTIEVTGIENLLMDLGLLIFILCGLALTVMSIRFTVLPLLKWMWRGVECVGRCFRGWWRCRHPLKREVVPYRNAQGDKVWKIQMKPDRDKR